MHSERDVVVFLSGTDDLICHYRFNYLFFYFQKVKLRLWQRVFFFLPPVYKIDEVKDKLKRRRTMNIVQLQRIEIMKIFLLLYIVHCTAVALSWSDSSAWHVSWWYPLNMLHLHEVAINYRSFFFLKICTWWGWGVESIPRLIQYVINHWRVAHFYIDFFFF